MSGFVFSFEHLAARLKNQHHGLVDREHIKSDHICLSCGKAMRLTRTIPGIDELPELRTYVCTACGVVFTESVETGRVARER
jgi:DNA-directed RNA polymerase subunit RPC12/RpoP